jgi:hypothetical protein
MGDQGAMVQLLSDWLQVPRAIEVVIEGFTEDDLNLRGGSDGWSIRETVHHLVESNLVACGIAIVAVGKSGCTHDCSWMNSDGSWMERMGRVPVAPAIDALSGLCRYVTSLLRAAPDALRSEVKLLGAPGAEPYAMSVEQMLQQEVEHVRKHLRDVNDTLKQRSR